MQTKNLEKTTEKKTTKQSKNNSKERLKKKKQYVVWISKCVFFFLTAELRSRSKNNKKIR